MVIAVMLNAGYMSPGCWVYEPGQRQNGRYSFHQDIVARGCDPSHAGADRGAQSAARRAIHLAGGGGFRAAGAAASGGGRSHSGGLAALAEIALRSGDGGGN